MGYLYEPTLRIIFFRRVARTRRSSPASVSVAEAFPRYLALRDVAHPSRPPRIATSLPLRRRLATFALQRSLYACVFLSSLSCPDGARGTDNGKKTARSLFSKRARESRARRPLKLRGNGGGGGRIY